MMHGTHVYWPTQLRVIFPWILAFAIAFGVIDVLGLVTCERVNVANFQIRTARYTPNRSGVTSNSLVA
jgi:hypothetical protein